MEYIIHDMISFEKLRNEKTYKNSIRRIKLDIADQTLSKKIEKRLNRHYFACGCMEGAIAVYASILVCVAIWLWGNFIFSRHWMIFVFTILGSALAGKLFGLVLSHYRLKKTFSELEKYFT